MGSGVGRSTAVLGQHLAPVSLGMVCPGGGGVVKWPGI